MCVCVCVCVCFHKLSFFTNGSSLSALKFVALCVIVYSSLIGIELCLLGVCVCVCLFS
jgi:hypothetical protein